MAVVRAVCTYHGPNRVFVREGDLYDSSDPVVKAQPGNFEPAAATRGDQPADVPKTGRRVGK